MLLERLQVPVRWKLAEIVKRANILKHVLAPPDQNVVFTVRTGIELPNLGAFCDGVADLFFCMASISHDVLPRSVN
jgi:hypothetical protein